MTLSMTAKSSFDAMITRLLVFSSAAILMPESNAAIAPCVSPSAPAAGAAPSASRARAADTRLFGFVRSPAFPAVFLSCDRSCSTFEMSSAFACSSR
jgi:hypothetical protein